MNSRNEPLGTQTQVLDLNKQAILVTIKKKANNNCAQSTGIGPISHRGYPSELEGLVNCTHELQYRRSFAGSVLALPKERGLVVRVTIHD